MGLRVRMELKKKIKFSLCWNQVVARGLRINPLFLFWFFLIQIFSSWGRLNSELTSFLKKGGRGRELTPKHCYTLKLMAKFPLTLNEAGSTSCGLIGYCA